MHSPIDRRLPIKEILGPIHPIESVSTSTTAFIGTASSGPLREPTKITSLMEYDQTFGGLSASSEMSYSVRQFFDNGGIEAWILRLPDPAASRALQASADDLALLANVKEPINLLCLPGITDASSLFAAAAFCESHRMFLIADTAKSATPPDIENTIANSQLPKTNSGAAYYPWINIPDPLNNNQPRLSAPSGAVAGIYARMDLNRGVWKAPAGTEASFQAIKGLSRAINETELSHLNSLGVNCLRVTPETGIVVWGARTLAGSDQANSEWKYVSVRRLFIFLEYSIVQGTQWAVFEPNDEPLWTRIRDSVSAFLYGIFRAGAFQGTTQQQAYYVKCGRDTMTQNDIDQGIVNIQVGFAPLKPAEFVIIRITQLMNQPNSKDEPPDHAKKLVRPFASDVLHLRRPDQN